MPSRVRLQYDALQVGHEDPDEFLTTELPALLEQIARILPHAPVMLHPMPVQGEPPAAHSGEPPPQAHLGTVRF
jgi:hypothetical protein